MVVLVFCLSFQRNQITPRLAACVQAQSPSRHRRRFQNESRGSSSLMVMPHECRMSINMSDRSAFYMPWLWRMTCLPVRNYWRISSAILDYVNSMLPHVNANDPIGCLRQFNVYVLCRLKTAFYQTNKINRTLKLY